MWTERLPPPILGIATLDISAYIDLSIHHRLQAQKNMHLNRTTLFSGLSRKDFSGRKTALVVLAVLGAAAFAEAVIVGMYPLGYAGALVGIFASAKLKP
jgi:hypothetical protein